MKARALRQIPNAITVFRIALVPLVIWLLFEASSNWQYWIALLLFVLAASTDGVDGAIARKKNYITRLGQILDPIADKVLIGGVLIALSALGVVSWWATVLILVREVGITVFRLIVVRQRVISASGGGKFKTILQIISVSFAIAPLGGALDWYGIWVELLIWSSVVVTLYSGFSYLRKV